MDVRVEIEREPWSAYGPTTRITMTFDQEAIDELVAGQQVSVVKAEVGSMLAPGEQTMFIWRKART